MRFLSGPGRSARRRFALVAGGGLLILVAAAVLVRTDRPPRREPHRDETHFPKGEAAYLAGDYDTAIECFTKSLQAEPRDARPYYRLVDSHARKGDLDAAERLLRSLVASDPQNARAHYGLGCLALKRQDLEAARAAAEHAARLDPSFGYARLLLGSVHNVAGRPREALRAWRHARRLFRLEGDREGEAWAVNRVGLVLRQLGEFRQALGQFEEALAIHGSLGNSDAQLIVLGNLGLTQADLGDIERAAVSFERALGLARDVGDASSECWLLSNLSYLATLIGEYGRAIEHADSAIAIARRIPDPVSEVAGLVNRAIAGADLGDPLASLAASRLALAIADSLADVRHRAGALLAIGEAYLDLGQLERARAAFARSDTLFRRIDLLSGSWSALVGLCEIEAREGDTTAAVVLAESTLDLFARSGYAEGEEFVALTLSDLLRRRGQPERALALATRAMELSRRDGRRSREALSRAQRAEAYLALNDAGLARREADEARRLARSVRSPEVVWFCEMAAGDATRLSDPDRALDHYRSAMDAVESTQRKLKLEEFKAGFLENRLDLYYKTMDLLVASGRDGEALEVCERARARAFRELLASSPAPVSPRVPEDLARRHRGLESRLRTLKGTLAGVAGSPTPDPSRIRALEDEIGRLKREWEEARAQVLIEDPRYASALPPASAPSAQRIARSLGPEEALVEYALGPQSSIGFAVTRAGIHAVRLAAGREDLAREIQELRRPLLAPGSLTTLSFDEAAAARLRERILDPLLPWLERATHLLVVPDGPLNYFPIEALPLSRDGDGGEGGAGLGSRATRFVCDRFAVRYLPSADLIGSSAPPSAPSAAAGPARTLLAMGNPVLPDEAERGQTVESAAPPTPARGLRRSESEVLAIAGMFPDAVVRTGAEATEASFKALARDSRFIHLSTHGVADEDVPLYSGLALAPDAAGLEDGFLHAYEILDLTLRCELVTLSACQTGLGRLYAGEGLLGLTRSFLYAGARQALVSLWSVDDASTAILMERFYEGLARGLDAADALQDAKKRLRDASSDVPGGGDRAYDHPFFWAAFVLVGAPRHLPS